MKFGRYSLILVVGLIAGALNAPLPASAQLSDILLAPKTLIDRAIEARSAQDIGIDNRIVVDVNAIMLEFTTLKASTEIYEQRLLVTGIFDDKALFVDFSAKVRAVEGVKELYWHVVFINAEAREKRKAELLGWDDVLVLNTKVGIDLIGTRGVADVNFRTAIDSFSTVYLLGRARSQNELDKALATVAKREGVAKVVNYAVVRP
ncbi:MAG: osmotically-inducible protein OsmY [Alphaproteobacteria bacterium]|jgi:osmotically-inducible protein OsmY